MSCFSSAYYHFGNNQNDVVDIVKKANLNGFVYSPLNNWIMFTAEGEPLTLNPMVVKGNHGILLHMVFAEDHCWGFQAFNDQDKITEYSCTWFDPSTWDETLRYNVDDSFEWLFQKINIDISPIRHLLFPTPNAMELIMSNNPAAAFCELLGLRSIEWISYEYIKDNPEIYTKDDPGMIEVQKQIS